MEMKSPPPCPQTSTVRRNPPRKARATPYSTNPQMPVPSSSTKVPKISSFPIDEILSLEVPINANPKSSSVSENLRVFLRIRPLQLSKNSGKFNGGITDQKSQRYRAKNVWPQNPAKKNSAKEIGTKNKKTREACIIVNDPHSVTLSPPLELQDSKRIKSEVYEGFSHVFDTNSSQEEVFEKMVSPMVDDFLKGKSGMLAALGPSGSGKTHTVFGCPRDPGVVPRVLQKIFKPIEGVASDYQRSFSISTFEIRSEGGKGERLFDLSSYGAELSMHQSTIKGLQEVTVSDCGEAESVIAKAMLKRVTAMTNSNSQSSRSQCIINISNVSNKSAGENDVEANNAVLSIIDLAGAEREKRTGNQGTRLLESNFINNTSMVFGLCLRSLLEHQKNPKKPLQKHFLNSLLTKYLREYLLGKKRMTLVLTVKSGEEDYLDATYLLRQASPFMNIKFDNVEEQSNVSQNKRQFQAFPRIERHKRLKHSSLENCEIEEGKSVEDEHQVTLEDAKTNSPKSSDVHQPERDRNHWILQNFAKALWNVLKEYKEKHKVAENEIQSLKENLNFEKTRCNEMAKELVHLKSSCTCSQENTVVVSEVAGDAYPKSSLVLNADESNMNIHSAEHGASEGNCIPAKYDFTQTQNQEIFSRARLNLHPSDVKASECYSTPQRVDPSPSKDHNILSEKNADFHSSNCDELKCNTAERCDATQLKCNTAERCDATLREDPDIFSEVQEHASLKGASIEDMLRLAPKEDGEPCQGCTAVDILHTELVTDKPEPHELCDKPLPEKEKVSYDVPDSEAREDNPPNKGKPKRRLLPASSVLLRDFSNLDIEDDVEKPKGNKGGKKFPADENKRTQGSISLLQLLRGNVRV